MGWQKALRVTDTKEPKQIEAASQGVLLQSRRQREEEEMMSKHLFFKLLCQNENEVIFFHILLIKFSHITRINFKWNGESYMCLGEEG